MGTLLALFFAAAGLLLSPPQSALTDSNLLPQLFAVFAIALAICQFIVLSLAYLPMQRAEQSLTPRIIELFKHDHTISWIKRGILLATFIPVFLVFFPVEFLVSPWVFGLAALGVSFDLLHLLISKILNYLNPYYLTKMITKSAEKSILQSREIDLCDGLESLSEISLKALNRFSTSLCNQSLDEMREVIRHFLSASKSIAVSDQEKQAQSLGITDKVSYTLFFFFDRLDMIYEKALEMHLTQVCSSILTLLGKVGLYAAKCDLTLVGYVVHYIGKFSAEAEKHHFSEVSLKGTCTLTALSKSIIDETQLTYMDLKDPFFSIITQLDEIAKTAFRQNKQTSIKFLTAPFEDLKKLFQSPKVAAHPDTPAIVKELDRVLAEWSTLETVLRTMPPIAASAMSPEQPSS